MLPELGGGGKEQPAWVSSQAARRNESTRAALADLRGVLRLWHPITHVIFPWKGGNITFVTLFRGKKEKQREISWMSPSLSGCICHPTSSFELRSSSRIINAPRLVTTVIEKSRVRVSNTLPNPRSPTSTDQATAADPRASSQGWGKGAYPGAVTRAKVWGT